MTDNDAAKALEIFDDSFMECHGNGGQEYADYTFTESQALKIRAALTKSAKVDGLLEALKDAIWLANDAIKLPDMTKAAKEYRYRQHIEMYEKALQRFNGEV